MVGADRGHRPGLGRGRHRDHRRAGRGRRRRLARGPLRPPGHRLGGVPGRDRGRPELRARPAQPAYGRRPPDQPLAVVISDPLTAQVADLFDAAHQTLLQLLYRLFVHDEETAPEVDTLAGAAIGLMAAVLRPLGSVLTTLPLGPDHPGELAGPAFFMVHPSQLLLPWREAAWKVMIQRLGAMADTCVRLGCGAGLGRVARVDEPVRGLAARLQGHLDERAAAR